MKRILLLAALVLVASTGQAQLRYGFKAGGNLSSLQTSSSLITNVDPVAGWNAGFILQYRSLNFSIQPEIIFSMKGADLDNWNGTTPRSAFLATYTEFAQTVSYRTGNIEVPINIQYGTEVGDFRIYGQAGPCLNIRLNGTLNGSSDLFKTYRDEVGFSAVDLGLSIGAGADWKRFQLALRYDFGTGEVGKKKGNTFIDNLNPFFDMKNRNLSLSLGYFF